MKTTTLSQWEEFRDGINATIPRVKFGTVKPERPIAKSPGDKHAAHHHGYYRVNKGSK